MKSTASSIEPLESRIAPAVIILSAHLATYTDADGDKVTIKDTIGDFTAANFTAVHTGAGDVLTSINLQMGGFDLTNLTISVAKVAGGDGFANIGYLNSTGHDLGAVAIRGDLGQIDAGDADVVMPGVKSLALQTMGRAGVDSGGGVTSTIVDGLGALTIKSDLVGKYLHVTGTAGNIGAITIGGSIIGGTVKDSGSIKTTGNIGAVKIGRDVQGGSALDTGGIESGGTMGAVTIGGSIIGGSSTAAGEILSGDAMGAVKIVGNLQGGTGNSSGAVESDGGLLKSITIGGSVIGGEGSGSGLLLGVGDVGSITIAHDFRGGGIPVGGIDASGGYIEVDGNLGSLTIGGSFVGGSGNQAGGMRCFGDIGKITIGHDLIGGTATSNFNLAGSGYIETTGHIGSVTIGGSIISGLNLSTVAQTENGSIRAGKDIASLTVKGSLIGHGDFGAGATPVIISAQNNLASPPNTDLVIGKITIGGSVERANIFAGYQIDLTPTIAFAQIGAVKIGGNWIASNLVASVKNLGADDAVGGTGANADNVNFGDTHDRPIGPGVSNIPAKIASITIGGQVFGTPAGVSSTDHFGFVSAAQIVALKIGGVAFPLQPLPHDDQVGAGGVAIFGLADLSVHEV